MTIRLFQIEMTPGHFLDLVHLAIKFETVRFTEDIIYAMKAKYTIYFLFI